MRTWAEINLDNLSHNVGMVRELSGGKEILGVIKANAYGMGAVEYARELAESGVKILGVACYEEACELRAAGIEEEILIFGCIPPEHVGTAIEKKFHLTINSMEEIDFLEKNSYYPKVHVKVDTGMGRVGFTMEQALEAIDYIRENNIGDLQGIYTHLSVADDPTEDVYTLEQMEKFRTFEGFEGIKYIHILNSCGSIRFGDKTYSTHVRPGILLQGIVPYDSKLQSEFKYVFELKTRILYMKKLEEEAYISYGKSYRGNEGDVIATLPVGYADGFNRKFSNGGSVMIKGHKCPVVGKVCMDMTMVKIPRELVPEVRVGTEVTLIGSDIAAKAEEIGTIPYEIMTGVGRRVSRCYIKGGKIVKIKSLVEVERNI